MIVRKATPAWEARVKEATFASPFLRLVRFLKRRPPNVPMQTAYKGPYRWPDGTLFYTQGDSRTCDKCRYCWPTNTVRCPRCGSGL